MPKTIRKMRRKQGIALAVSGKLGGRSARRGWGTRGKPWPRKPSGAFAHGYQHWTGPVQSFARRRGVGTGERSVQSGTASTVPAGLGRGGTPGCCSGPPACSCSGSPTAHSAGCCSSSRRESHGPRPLTAHQRRFYHSSPELPARHPARAGEGHEGRGLLLQGPLVDPAIKELLL